MLIIKICVFLLRCIDFFGLVYSGCDGIVEFIDILGVDFIGDVIFIIDYIVSCL